MTARTSSSLTLACEFFITLIDQKQDTEASLLRSAKHLHNPEEQLHSLAGSFGYVAPEVLNKSGHGKAVDMWSTGYVHLANHIIRCHQYFCLCSIITYVLLSGYSPFRSDDVKELIRETTAAKIEFHERYWKNISQEGLLSFLILPIVLDSDTDA